MNLANRLTMLRIFLVPVFIASLLYFTPERHYLYTVAVLVYLLACVTDGLDGYLARRMNEHTQLGSYIDPIADKLLLLSGYLSLSLMPHIPADMHVPAWVTLTVISRDVVILLGSVIIFIATGKLKAKPLFVGKVTTVVQMGTLLASLLALPWNIREVLFVLTVIFTLWTAMLYIRMGGQMFQES
jgi:cardiolipin synthase (CMP-forming)